MTSDSTRSGFNGPYRRQRRLTVSGDFDPIACGAQQPLDVVTHVEIVVGQQDETIFSLLRQRSQVLRLGRCRRVGRSALVAEPARRLLHISLCPNAGRCALAGGLHAIGRKMGRAQRQTNGEGATDPDLACHGNRATLQADQLLHQRQADAAAFDAAAARALDAMEALEQMRQLYRGYARAGIAHRDLDRLAVDRRPDGDDDFSLEGEFQRIGQKIEDDLLPHVAVDMDGRRQWWTIDTQVKAGAGDGRAEGRGELGGEATEVDRLEGRLGLAGFDA